MQLALNNGQIIPQLGLGVYKVNQDIAVQLVGTALDLGYRRIDTAALYDNEQEVGAATSCKASRMGAWCCQTVCPIGMRPKQ